MGKRIVEPSRSYGRGVKGTSLACAATLALAAGVVGPSAHAGLIINRTYDPSVTSQANFAQIQAAFDYAAQQFQTAYTDNVTVNINVVAANPTSGILGQSEYNLIGTTYSEIKAQLVSHASTAADLSAIANLPLADPTGGQNYWMNFAQAKALNLLPRNNVALDGTFTFGLGYNYTYDPANRAVANKYDFIGVAEHEISEIMGRAALLGSDITSNNVAAPGYLPFDLFRFTGPHAPTIDPASTGVYFSVDGGVTSLKGYNSNAGADLQDWVGGANDAYNAFSSNSVANTLSPVDVTTLDILGWTPATPEPASAMVTIGALACGSMLRRRPKPLILG